MIVKKKNIDPISRLGYSDNSPYRNRPENLIKSNIITMHQTSIPLMGIGLDSFGKEVERKEMPANSGQHVFEKSIHVKEVPMAIMKKKPGGVLCATTMMQSGGIAPLYVQNPNSNRLRAYNDSTTKYNMFVNDKRQVDQKLQQYSKTNGVMPVKENIKPAMNSNTVTGQRNDPTNMVSYNNRPGQPKFDEVYHQYKKPKQPVVLIKNGEGSFSLPGKTASGLGNSFLQPTFQEYKKIQPEIINPKPAAPNPILTTPTTPAVQTPGTPSPILRSYKTDPRTGYQQEVGNSSKAPDSFIIGSKDLAAKKPAYKGIVAKRSNMAMATTKYQEGGKLIQLNGENGKVQLHLDGGERIFSRKNTEALVKVSKTARSEKELEALGKMAYSFLKIQDTRKPEYVAQ